MNSSLVNFNFDNLASTGYVDGYARVMVMHLGQLYQVTLNDLAMSMQAAGLMPPLPPLPSTHTTDFSSMSDADLIMTALSRGFILQKQPS